MTIPTTRIFAFLGATGGCTNACLAHTLLAGFHASALARTPSKLVQMLLAQGIPQTTIDSQLRIVKGDSGDVSAVKNILLVPSTSTAAGEGEEAFGLVSAIVSGIGGVGKLQWSLRRPVTVNDPDLCTNAAKTVVQALREIYETHPSLVASGRKKPSITVISSTGISQGPEDVPFGLRTLYHVILADPHKDKREMENLALENANNNAVLSSTTDAEGKVFGGAIIVRATLMKGDQSIKDGKGWKKLKVGTEDKPAVGYSVRRADVGEWIFEEVVRAEDEGVKWFGQKVTLTN
ncbi:hypothetical protein K457DRAFT_18309 [Linnemannia elongata AG-77]|uniref:NAD(P)-binding domain-containing protein n=1 Tax=Linnemannia elongata AG-77 TaxID=1314771 RepID=A0A197JYP2_9FUNG|nr:hypothetical protein K457DRAFT_18309 [Linnemannia elongata AG-77]